MGNTDLERHIWQNRDRFYRLAYSYVGNQQDALDIVSDSIVKALKSQKRLRNREAIKTWFYGIVIHTACDFLRRRKQVVYTVDVPETGLEDRHNDLDLADGLARLPEQLRAIVVLRFFEDLKIEEIAGVLDVNVNTVKSRLYRALRMLKIELSADPAERRILAGGHLDG